MLKNIKALTEKKDIKLKSISPDILKHINRFDNLNNFEKKIVIEEKEPEPLTVMQLKRSRKDGGKILRTIEARQ